MRGECARPAKSAPEEPKCPNALNTRLVVPGAIVEHDPIGRRNMLHNVLDLLEWANDERLVRGLLAHLFILAQSP